MERHAETPVGGIDLAYGRYDDERFTLKCDEDGREVMNRYNPCIPALLAVPEPITIDPNKTEPISRTLSAPTANPDPPRNDTMDKLNGGRKSLPPEELRTTKASKWQVPYDDPGTVDIITNGRSTDTPSRLTLDPARQARMPWQDMHARMEGPCVSDILRNFMDRWHVSGGVRLPPAPPMQQFAAAGSTMVQVLRSASAGQRKLESGQLNKTDSHPCEDHIKQAMCKLIKKADHFIYIENQFFVGKLGERYVTEQVYVHTKLMIVDDRYALFGSANINDRSLNGEGDSEIALLVTDQDVSKADLCGDGVKRPVRNFARKLRMDIWRKLFGIGLKPSAVGGVKPADHLLSAIEKPAAPASWRAIQKQAEENAAAYEAVFDYIPRSWRYTAAGQKKASSIIPNWDPQKKPPIKETKNMGKIGYPGSSLPHETSFWTTTRHNSDAIDHLKKIRGFISALPIHWSKGERNNFPYPTGLVARQDNPAPENFKVAQDRPDISTKEV